MIKRIFDAFVYMLINVGGSFIPLLAAILYPLILDEKKATLADLTGKGEIAIICIPLCISIAFILYNYKKEIGISKIAHFTYIITFFWLIMAAGLYAYGVNKLDSPKSGLITFSMYFLGWTIVSMVIAKFVENETLENLKGSRNDDQNNLEKKFNKA